MARAAKNEITLGAIYKLGARRGFDRSTLVSLISERAGLSANRATLLAGHWLTTEAYRCPASQVRRAA